MNIRKNIYTLTDAQLQAFKDAVNAIKADGTYDDFIERHHHSMMTADAQPGEVGRRNVHVTWRTGARRSCRGTATSAASSSSLLQTNNPLVTLPYWDWVADAGNPLGRRLVEHQPRAAHLHRRQWHRPERRSDHRSVCRVDSAHRGHQRQPRPAAGRDPPRAG